MRDHRRLVAIGSANEHMKIIRHLVRTNRISEIYDLIDELIKHKNENSLRTLKYIAKNFLPTHAIDVKTCEYLENYEAVIMIPRSLGLRSFYSGIISSYKNKNTKEDANDLDFNSFGIVFLGVFKRENGKFLSYYNDFSRMLNRQENRRLYQHRELQYYIRREIDLIPNRRMQLIQDVQSSFDLGDITQEELDLELKYLQEMSDERIFNNFSDSEYNYKESQELLKSRPKIEGYFENITWEWEQIKRHDSNFTIPEPDEIFSSEQSMLLAMKENYDEWFKNRDRNYETINFDKEYEPNTPLFRESFEFEFYL